MKILVHEYEKKVGKGSQVVKTPVFQVPDDEAQAVCNAINKAGLYAKGKTVIGELPILNSVADFEAEQARILQTEIEDNTEKVATKLNRFSEIELTALAQKLGVGVDDLKKVTAAAPKGKKRKKKSVETAPVTA